MNIANQVTINRINDHFVLRFGLRVPSGSADSDVEPVAAVALPLTAAIELTLTLFESMVSSIMELQTFFGGLQSRFDRIAQFTATDRVSPASGTHR